MSQSRQLDFAVVLLFLVLVAGCGLGAQREAEPVVPVPSTEEAAPRGADPSDDTHVVRIFLVRAQRLVPVARCGGPSLQDALDLLAAGPTAQEVSEGFETALTPQPLTGIRDAQRPGLARIGVTTSFTALSGRLQLIAVAELVWTATDVAGIDRVLVELDGRPIVLPTDTGLSGEPVRRADYRSLAPAR